MASWHQVLLKVCSYVLVLSFNRTISISCWHGIMLVCSHSYPRCHCALALSCSHGLMPACSQSPSVTYVQRDAPSWSRFPFLDSTGFRNRAPTEAKRPFFENKGSPEPRTSPRAPEELPRPIQETPKRPQELSKRLQEDPKDAPRAAKEAS